MVGYKITIGYDQDRWKLYLVELDIPEDAEIVTPYVNSKYPKYRCNRAIVKETYCLNHVFNDIVSDEKYLIQNKKHLRSTYSLYEVYSLILQGTSCKDYIKFVRDGKYTVYTKNKEVTPDMLDKDRKNVCSEGIHFFENKEDCLNWLNQGTLFAKSLPVTVVDDANFHRPLAKDILEKLHASEPEKK